MELKEMFEGVFTDGRDLYTKNLVPGQTVYGERIVNFEGEEYRRWDPYRSKLAGAIKKGLKNFSFHSNTDVLYLGASTGTTVSHLSDIVVDGTVFAVEVAPQMAEKLIALAEKRPNIVPILADARKPSSYEEIGEVDVLYQDIAQPDQERIFLMNVEKFLKKGHNAYLCLKTQSIDVTKPKEEVLSTAKKLLSSLALEEVLELSPYDKEHYFMVMRK